MFRSANRTFSVFIDLVETALMEGMFAEEMNRGKIKWPVA
jgi:hypothetical protein